METSLPKDNFVLEVLEHKLSELASQWRGANSQNDVKMTQAIVSQYQAVLLCMIELGHDDFLDAESELPDRLMPAQYFEWVDRLNTSR